MVFLRSHGLISTSWTPASSLTEIKAHFVQFEEFSLKFYKNGKPVEVNDVFGHDEVVEVVAGLLGGKGGFGSMLRALGAQIEKTTNKEACRDLSGRRLRDINEEKRLKNFVSQKAERERLKKETKEAKLKKLHKLVTVGETKHEFKDKKYDEAREAATDRVHEALNEVFSNPELKASVSGKKRKAADDEPSNKKKEEDKQPKASTSSGKPSAAKKGLWIGVELNDSDLEDSSDEEEEKASTKT
jgi:hypothetical protein